MKSVKYKAIFSYVSEQFAFFYQFAQAKNCQRHRNTSKKIQRQRAIIGLIHIHISQAGCYLQVYNGQSQSNDKICREKSFAENFFFQVAHGKPDGIEDHSKRHDINRPREIEKPVSAQKKS